MKDCKRCGSQAINENNHDRIRGVNSNLCDVCYWRAIAEALEIETEQLKEIIKQGLVIPV